MEQTTDILYHLLLKADLPYLLRARAQLLVAAAADIEQDYEACIFAASKAVTEFENVSQQSNNSDPEIITLKAHILDPLEASEASDSEQDDGIKDCNNHAKQDTEVPESVSCDEQATEGSEFFPSRGMLLD